MTVRLHTLLTACTAALLVCSAASAQRTRRPQVKTYRETFPNSRAVRRRFSAYKRGDKYMLHGVERWYFRSGKTQRKTEWAHNKRHGRFIEFYGGDEVKIKAKGTFDRGRRHGLWETWYDNLQKHTEVDYVHGKKHGTARKWNRAGKEVLRQAFADDKPHGVSMAWHDNGRKRHRREFREGVLHGDEQTWYDSGQQRHVAAWKDGKKHGTEKHWALDGTPKHEVTWQDGVKHGLEREWFADGKPKRTTPYVDGNKHGTEKLYYAGGGLKETIPFKQGKREGTAVAYYANGKKRRQTPWVNDKRDGAEWTWSVAGHRRSLLTWRQDRLHGPEKHFDAQGELDYEGENKNGQPHQGTFIIGGTSARDSFRVVYEDGAVVDHIFLVDGKPYTGTWKAWFDPDETRLRRQTEYQDGRRHGPETLWFENGNTRLEMHWTNDKPDGMLSQWYANGNKAWQVQFVEGRKHGREQAWRQRDGKQVCDGQWRNGKPWSGTVIVEKDDGHLVVQQFDQGKRTAELSGDLLENFPRLNDEYDVERRVRRLKGKARRRVRED